MQKKSILRMVLLLLMHTASLRLWAADSNLSTNPIDVEVSAIIRKTSDDLQHCILLCSHAPQGEQIDHIEKIDEYITEITRLYDDLKNRVQQLQSQQKMDAYPKALPLLNYLKDLPWHHINAKRAAVIDNDQALHYPDHKKIMQKVIQSEEAKDFFLLIRNSSNSEIKAAYVRAFQENVKGVCYKLIALLPEFYEQNPS